MHTGGQCEKRDVHHQYHRWSNAVSNLVYPGRNTLVTAGQHKFTVAIHPSCVRCCYQTRGELPRKKLVLLSLTPADFTWVALLQLAWLL